LTSRKKTERESEIVITMCDRMQMYNISDESVLIFLFYDNRAYKNRQRMKNDILNYNNFSDSKRNGKT
jgi:hypothetical protein